MSLNILKRSKGDGMLVSLVRVKAELGISSADLTYDAALALYIREASAAFEAATRRKFSRCTVAERLTGSGSAEELLTITPVLRINEVQYDSAVQSLLDIQIGDADAGVVHNKRVWLEQLRHSRFINVTPRTDHLGLPWLVQYVAGWNTPEAVVVAEDAEFVALDDSITMSGLEDLVLVAGDRVVVSGTTNNNGTFTVSSQDGDSIEVEELLIDESAEGSITLDANNLPPDISMEVLYAVITGWKRKGADRSISSEKIGDWAVSYRDASSAGASSVVAAYRRLM